MNVLLYYIYGDIKMSLWKIKKEEGLRQTGIFEWWEKRKIHKKYDKISKKYLAEAKRSLKKCRLNINKKGF